MLKGGLRAVLGFLVKILVGFSQRVAAVALQCRYLRGLDPSFYHLFLTVLLELLHLSIASN